MARRLRRCLWQRRFSQIFNFDSYNYLLLNAYHLYKENLRKSALRSIKADGESYLRAINLFYYR